MNKLKIKAKELGLKQKNQFMSHLIPWLLSWCIFYILLLVHINLIIYPPYIRICKRWMFDIFVDNLPKWCDHLSKYSFD